MFWQLVLIGLILGAAVLCTWMTMPGASPPPEPSTDLPRQIEDWRWDGRDQLFDDRNVLENPVFQKSTALINIRPMRTHHWSGLGTCIKNHIMFSPEPWAYHPNSCEHLGKVWQLPLVKGKTRLNVLVMLTPLFHGTGPHHYSPEFVWPYAGLIVSRDPVAADATGARIIQAKRNRHFGGDRPISPPPLHIAAADTLYRLGQSRPDRIQLIRLGEQEGSLI